MRKSTKRPRLSARQVSERVFRRVAKYENLSGLEQFAMFMGKAQVLEFRLKRLLVRLFSYDQEAIERWTMGRTIRELKASGLRGDYIALLEDLVEYRNFITHEYLASEALLRRLVGRNLGRLHYKYLERGIFKVEEAIVVFDWLESMRSGSSWQPTKMDV